MSNHQKQRPAVRLGAGTSSVESINSPNHSTQGWTLDLRLWALEYSAEEARQRYADRRQFRREFCMRVVLALLRIAGGRT